jgi:hypothetical protein
VCHLTCRFPWVCGGTALETHMHQERQRLNTREATVYLGLSSSTLAKMRLTGKGPVFRKLNGRVVYDTRDLDRYLNDRACTSTSDLNHDRSKLKQAVISPFTQWTDSELAPSTIQRMSVQRCASGLQTRRASGECRSIWPDFRNIYMDTTVYLAAMPELGVVGYLKPTKDTLKKSRKRNCMDSQAIDFT